MPSSDRRSQAFHSPTPIECCSAARGGTKLDLARYYESIADWVLPHLVDRPLTLVRCGMGVPASGARQGVDCIFMKHAKAWGPTAIRRLRIREKTKTGEYLIVDTLPALVGLVQMDILEIHTWNSRFAKLEQPDRIVIDLDPGEKVQWPQVVIAARLVRDLLDAIGLESFVKTTGGRGLHVVIPVASRLDWSDCLAFARAFAQSLVRCDPFAWTRGATITNVHNGSLAERFGRSNGFEFPGRTHGRVYN